MKCLALCQQPAGISSRQPTSFSLSRQSKGGKRKATPMPAPLGCAKGFPAVLGAQTPARNALRSLRSLRLNGRAESVHVARCARGSALLCSSAGHRGPRETARTVEVRAIRYLAVGCLGSPLELPSIAAAWGVRASALPPLARGGRSSAVSATNGARSAPCPKPREAQGTPWLRQGAAERGSPFFASFLWRSKERKPAAGTESRRALPQQAAIA